MHLTAKKYALSPGPSGFPPLMCFAYGGPHARVSSPLVGCSILITSALFRTQDVSSARSIRLVVGFEAVDQCLLDLM